MDGKKLAKLLLLMMALELMLFSSTKGWRRRRRRRRRRRYRRPAPPLRCSSSRPSGVPWVNTWHQTFARNCPDRKEINVLMMSPHLIAPNFVPPILPYDPPNTYYSTIVSSIEQLTYSLASHSVSHSFFIHSITDSSNGC